MAAILTLGAFGTTIVEARTQTFAEQKAESITLTETSGKNIDLLALEVGVEPVLVPQPSFPTAKEQNIKIVLSCGDDCGIGGPEDIEVEEVKAQVKKEEVKDSSKNKKEEKIATASAGSTYVSPVPGAKITQGLHGKNGIDFGSPEGTTVVAFKAGKVSVAYSSGWNGGYGSYVVIQHEDGSSSLYAHLSTVSVSVGDTVAASDVVGAIGMTGRTTGPHLHFEVHGSSNPFN